MQLRQQLLSAVPAFLSALKDGNIDGFNASLAALLDTLAAAEAAGSLSPEDRSIGGIVSKFIEEFATRMIKIEEADEKARASMRAEVDAALDQTTFCPDSKDASASASALSASTFKRTNSKSTSAVTSESSKPVNENPANFRHLRDWYLSHMDDPFPKVDEKKVLAAQKGITVQSLNLWFTNMRRRSGWTDFTRTYTTTGQTKEQMKKIVRRYRDEDGTLDPALVKDLREIEDYIDERGQDKVRHWMESVIKARVDDARAIGACGGSKSSDKMAPASSELDVGVSGQDGEDEEELSGGEERASKKRKLSLSAEPQSPSALSRGEEVSAPTQCVVRRRRSSRQEVADSQAGVNAHFQVPRQTILSPRVPVEAPPVAFDTPPAGHHFRACRQPSPSSTSTSSRPPHLASHPSRLIPEPSNVSTLPSQMSEQDLYYSPPPNTFFPEAAHEASHTTHSQHAYSSHPHQPYQHPPVPRSVSVPSQAPRQIYHAPAQPLQHLVSEQPQQPQQPLPPRHVFYAAYHPQSPARPPLPSVPYPVARNLMPYSSHPQLEPAPMAYNSYDSGCPLAVPEMLAGGSGQGLALPVSRPGPPRPPPPLMHQHQPLPPQPIQPYSGYHSANPSPRAPDGFNPVNAVHPVIAAVPMSRSGSASSSSMGPPPPPSMQGDESDARVAVFRAKQERMRAERDAERRALERREAQEEAALRWEEAHLTGESATKA